MRKEFLGPLPVLLGVIIALAAAMASNAPPAANCDCPVRSPADFDALNAGGYAGVGLNDTIVVDGRVVSVAPPTLVDSPYHLLRLDGSPTQYNVTQFDGAVPFEGSWVRLSTVHQGQSEAGGPDTGHRWRYLGPTTPGGDAVISISGTSAGVVLALWGVATLGAFGRARRQERDLKDRAERAEAAARGEPSVAGDPEALLPLAAARRAVRRGQYSSAEETLTRFESQVERSRAAGQMAGEMEAAIAANEEAAGARGRSEARAFLDTAVKARAEGDIPAAEAALDKAMSKVQDGSRALETVLRAKRLAEEEGSEGELADRARALFETAYGLLASGSWTKAAAAADEALDAAFAASPSAARARRAVLALEEAAASDRTGDASREVAHQLAAARTALAAGDFDRAVALSDAARWVVDPAALDDEAMRAVLARRWGALGWRAEVGAARPPAGGTVFAKGGQRMLVLTAGWREFPTERVLLAAKDFLRDGHADSARVYSSAFANTSTDPAITVVTMRQLIEELTQAAELSPEG